MAGGEKEERPRGVMSHIFSKGEPAPGVGLLQELGRREEVRLLRPGEPAPQDRAASFHGGTTSASRREKRTSFRLLPLQASPLQAQEGISNYTGLQALQGRQESLSTLALQWGCSRRGAAIHGMPESRRPPHHQPQQCGSPGSTFSRWASLTLEPAPTPSNNTQPMRRFMQTFVLAPEGSVANKFYVHNDIFRYQDEVFGDLDAEPPEESEEETEEPEERQQTPEAVADDSTPYYEQAVNNDLEEQLEEQVVEPEQETEPEPEQEPEPEAQEDKPEPVLEESAPEETVEKSPSPVPVDPAPVVQEDSRTSSWASVTSKNLPPSGAVPVSGIPPHVVKLPVSQPRPESKPESQTPPQRPQRDQRVREQRTSIPPQRGPRPMREGEQGDMETRRIVRYPDSHQLFVGNLPHDVDKAELKEFFQKLANSLAGYGNVVELRINSGGKLPNFGFVVFDDPEPVQKILANRPIMFRGEVRLNVEEKKTRAAREGDRRDNRPRGPGGPRGGLGGGIRGPPRGGMSQKPGFGTGRGIGQRQ